MLDYGSFNSRISLEGDPSVKDLLLHSKVQGTCNAWIKKERAGGAQRQGQTLVVLFLSGTAGV
jgi:hypothetical protein